MAGFMVPACTRFTISSRERSKMASRICSRSCVVGLRHHEQHARAVLDVARRKQLPLQQLHDDRRLRPVKASRIAVAVQLGEELRGPFVVIVPHLLEQLPGEAGSGLDLLGVRRQHHAVFGERRPLEDSRPW